MGSEHLPLKVATVALASCLNLIDSQSQFYYGFLANALVGHYNDCIYYQNRYLVKNSIDLIFNNSTCHVNNTEKTRLMFFFIK